MMLAMRASRSATAFLARAAVPSVRRGVAPPRLSLAAAAASASRLGRVRRGGASALHAAAASADVAPPAPAPVEKFR